MNLLRRTIAQIRKDPWGNIGGALLVLFLFALGAVAIYGRYIDGVEE